MAGTVVKSVVDKLFMLLTDEVTLLTGIHKEIAGIKDELESIQSFLRDADMRVEQEGVDSGMKTWVKQVREVAYQIEDVIDDYRLRVATRRDHTSFLSNITCLAKKLMPRHKVASKIQSLRTSLREMKERSDRYRFVCSSEQARSNSSNTWNDPRVASLFIDEAELVGIESPRDELVSRLVGGTSSNMVVSVVGMGGIGKTTLAKKVYDDRRVSTHFDCQAWITVSQSYKVDKLLKLTVRQFQRSKNESMLEGIETMEESMLFSEVRQYLSERRYVVVFYDVWTIEFWGYMKYAFPDNEKGSRIIITTRSEDVAPSFKESPFYQVYKLPPLPEDKAVELFHKKVFQSHGGICPPQLLALSHSITERCEGLPLAIVMIGGLLAIKEKSVSEWQKLFDGLSAALATNQRLANISRILSLSCHDLPYHLKTCFLYFGMFPEDHLVNRSTLIRLWIAEGFIRERQGASVEEVAEEYLTELILRSMVQEARAGLNGRAKECRVHDLMHGVILSRSKELGFRHSSVRNCMNSKRMGRHLSVGAKANNVLEIDCNFETHSVLLFEVDEIPKSLVSKLANFKLLKVLNFEGTPLEYIPKELGNLLNLSFLSLRRTRVQKLPRSVGKLRNLETLDLRECLVHELPADISKFTKLRHLLAYYFDSDAEQTSKWLHGLKIQGSIGSLVALQKLHYIEVDQDMGLIKDLERLSQLRKLGIKILKTESTLPLCAALVKMTHLRSLRISSEDEEEFLELQPLNSPPPLLKRLYLFGPLPGLPHWISQLNSLAKIHLYWSRLGDDALHVLQALPGLQELQLFDGCTGEQLHFRMGCFQNLKVLKLRKLTGQKKVTIDEGALPLLEDLFVGPFPQLQEVPSGIHFLRNLKTLQFFDIQKELTLAMLPNSGEEYWRIEHVPDVLFHYTIKGVRRNVYKLGDPNLVKYLER